MVDALIYERYERNMTVCMEPVFFIALNQTSDSAFKHTITVWEIETHSNFWGSKNKW